MLNHAPDDTSRPFNNKKSPPSAWEVLFLRDLCVWSFKSVSRAYSRVRRWVSQANATAGLLSEVKGADHDNRSIAVTRILEIRLSRSTVGIEWGIADLRSITDILH